MIQVILTRLGSNHQNLRSDEIVGETEALPQVGEGFTLLAAPIAENAFCRVVSTTPVREVRLHPEEGSLEFWTANSHYGLQVLDMKTQGGCN